MKFLLLLALAAGSSAAFIGFVQPGNNPDKARAAIAEYRNKYALGCRPDLLSLNLADEENAIPLLSGWGKYRMNIVEKNDSAALYFQQGINMYYGFHIIEALASFEKAVKFDPDFAMGYWGKALAYGPNINDMGYAASPDALAAVKKAETLSSGCTDFEKSLIRAMSARYSADSTQSREQLNQDYADAMEKVHAAFPGNADAATLYADALMIQHPWDLYDHNYEPKSWTPKIVDLLTDAVKRFPDNPGACHLYIHAVEGSKHPQVALAVANRIGAMMPGLSHLVHMPSHIYIRSGHYGKGITVNKTAIKDYDDYLEKFPPVNNGLFLYLMHNQHMEIACSMMDGQYRNALATAIALNDKIDSSMLDAGGFLGMYSQYVYCSPAFIQLRFGKWDEIISMPLPAQNRVYATVLTHFAKGVAYARTGQVSLAADELQQLQQQLSNPQLQEAPPAFNPGIAGAQVAEKILEGVLAEAKNDLPAATRLLTEAVEKEDGMLYTEPRDWLLPARHFLAGVLLKARRYDEAIAVCKKDLFVNPENAWALTGLKLALREQKHTKEMASVQKRLNKAAARKDVPLLKVVE